MIRSTSLLCLLALFAGVYSQCVQDYECGNVPYSVCNGGVNDCASTVPGIGIDPATNKVYFAQICRTDKAQITNVTFKTVDSKGGVPTLVQTRQQQPAAVNPGQVFDVVEDRLYFSIQSRSPGQLLTSLNLNSLAESKTIDTDSFFQNIIEFDTTNKKTYVCNIIFKEGGSYFYDLRGFDGILADGVGAVNNYSMYTVDIPSVCSAIRVQGSDLFFTVVTPNADYTAYSTSFYKGSTSCVECNNAALLFTVANSKVVDFDVTSTRVFYGTTTGVYSSDFSGANVKHVSWSSGSSGVRVLGDRVYWNSGVAILSDSVNGGEVKQLNTFSGSCGCRHGFTGASCTTCNGQVQWFEGIPACIPFGEDGNPTSCNFDYECAGSPYTYCSGSCKCRTGFSGAGCRQCEDSTKKVTWSNGIPSCA